MKDHMTHDKIVYSDWKSHQLGNNLQHRVHGCAVACCKSILFHRTLMSRRPIAALHFVMCCVMLHQPASTRRLHQRYPRSYRLYQFLYLLGAFDGRCIFLFQLKNSTLQLGISCCLSLVFLFTLGFLSLSFIHLDNTLYKHVLLIFDGLKLHFYATNID